MRGNINNAHGANRVLPRTTTTNSRGSTSGGVVLGGRTNNAVNNNIRKGTTTTTRSKITIKPFAKPPKLPDNYYEETAQTILKGTLQFLEQRKNASNSSSNNHLASPSQPSSTMDGVNQHQQQYSLQSAYNNTTHLVSHQFGGRLYADLVETFHIAAERVLQHQYQHLQYDADPSGGSSRNASQDSKIMEYVVKQYNIYTDYLLLCKHVLTPLDRTWQWQDMTQKAIPIHSTSSTSTSAAAAASPTSVAAAAPTLLANKNKVAASSPYSPTSTNSSMMYPLQNIWQVGLTCFLRRLQTLQLDQLLYQQWLTSFIHDWNGTSNNSNNNNNSNMGYSSSTMNTEHSSSSRQTLQHVWYLWQDLGLLSQLTIQQDLEQYWTKQSLEWASLTSLSTTQGSGYPIQSFIQVCYEKHIHCYHYRQWLPVLWLWNVLDTFLFQPHLMLPTNTTTDTSTTMNWTSSSTTTSNPLQETPLLVREENLFPVLQDAIFQQKQLYLHDQKQYNASNHNNTTTVTAANNVDNNTNRWNTVQILWMLAGRLHGGQKVVANTIQRFARTQGLQCVQGNNSGKIPPPLNVVGGLTSTVKITNVNAVQDLLQLQDSLSSMIQSLPVTSTQNNITGGGGGGGGGGGLVLLPNSLPTTNVSSNMNNNIISLKSVWEEVVNVETEPSIAEQLAKFLDGILKSNKKIDQYQNYHQTSSMINSGGLVVVQPGAISSTAWLHRIVMGLFVPLSSKDIFEAFYKKDLAKRLLWNRVVSMDIEKQVCSLLKAECGAGYTSKMEGMFQDIEWSRETMAVYKESTMNYSSITNSGGGNIVGGSTQKESHDDAIMSDITVPDMTNVKPVEMEVQVLTTGYWPVYPQFANLQLPSSFQIPQNQFNNHYKTKYQGRRMTWQYALGHCTVRAVGFNKPYDLVVSLCQALTLLQFTNKDINVDGGGWTLPELQRSIGLDDRDEMERILQSLAIGKDGTRILRKIDFDRDTPSVTPGTSTSITPGTSAGGDSMKQKSAASPNNDTIKKQSVKKIRMNVDDKDKFVINNTFDSSVRRIRINNILMKETKEEHDKTVEGISRDRLYLIDAVLVRIMKARKTILHQQLIPQVLEQIKVPALPADVKHRIESLIEREYMERDSKDRNRYNYLA